MEADFLAGFRGQQFPRLISISLGVHGSISENDSTLLPVGKRNMLMELRKYSTGTKGRIKMHSDKCKEFIRANTTFNLAKEFIESIDPDYNEQVWQRFQSAEEILPELQAWLGGGEDKPAAPAAVVPPALRHPVIKVGSQVAWEKEKLDAAMKKTRAWLASDSGQTEVASLSPSEAAEVAIERLYLEITGKEPQ